MARPVGGKAEAEQKLLDPMPAEQPQVCTPDRLWIMDRNFPGVPRITAMPATGSHVLIRVTSDIRLPRISPFAQDGSYLTRLSGGGTTLNMRVIEYHITLDGQTTPELFCLVTDLLDHTTHPAQLLADAYRWRWDGSETALREATSAIHNTGPGTGAILRSHSPDLIRQEHPTWITATELVHATTRAAAATAAPFRKGPRTGQPVAARHLSFTTTRRTLITTDRAATTTTASLPEPARAAAHHHALAVITTARVTTDRHHHRDRKIKSRQAFPHAPHAITTRTAPAHLHICGTTAASRPHGLTRPDPTPSLDQNLTTRAWNPAHPARQPGHHHAPSHPSPSMHQPEDHHEASTAPRTTSSPWHCPPLAHIGICRESASPVFPWYTSGTRPRIEHSPQASPTHQSASTTATTWTTHAPASPSPGHSTAKWSHEVFPIDAY